MVKVKEIKHSDEEVSSEDSPLSAGESGEEEYDSEGPMNPFFDDMAEEGEIEMEDYDEEGEDSFIDDEEKESGSDMSDSEALPPTKRPAKALSRSESSDDDSSEESIKPAPKARKVVSESSSDSSMASDEEEIALAK